MKEKNLKYGMPQFLNGTSNQIAYHKWLHRKAIAHIRRDRRRGNTTGTNEEYKVAIHLAVCESEGRDAYTGEVLAWDLIGTYDNEQSKLEKRLYKTKLALLPTVDHIGDGTGRADFRICSWRTNDAKNDMSLIDFVRLCQLVVDFHKDKKWPGTSI
jgi:hypothetical protein